MEQKVLDPRDLNLDTRDMAKNKEKVQSTDLSIPEGYLTLKEAAELTEYTPDYLGQLVRAGKLEGKQVYSNVAWVTSESSLREYLAQKGKDMPALQGSGLPVELPDFARPLLYIVIGCAVMLLIILIHIVSISVDRALTSALEERVSQSASQSL